MAVSQSDMVVTWPRSKPLEDYLAELERAVTAGLSINFRVPTMPSITPERCYMVHSGFVRGYNHVLGIAQRGEGEVRRTDVPPITDHGVTGQPYVGYWPAGFYVVRDPRWYPLAEPIPMRGFQGYRYIERPE